jgi:uncharacterized SAM-binding protein YcdF (DUF218 family)
MTLAGLIVIAVIASLFALFKWRRTSTTLYTLWVILFFAVGCGPLPAWMLDKLQSPYLVKPVVEWGHRNAIVLLGAGTTKIAQANLVEPGTFSYARLVETAGLYNDCRKTQNDCKIIISGGDALHNGSPEAVTYGDTLIRMGISATNIIPEAQSMNTWQNAQFTSAALKDYGADRVLLVSSGIHLKRSVLYFTHFGVTATPVRGDYLKARLSVLPLSYNFAVADFALHEYIGIARYYVYNALDLNAAKPSPQEN